MKIRDLKISARARTCLINAGYSTIEEIIDFTDDEFLKIRNINAKCVKEIRSAITEFNNDPNIDIIHINDQGSIKNVMDTPLEELEFSVRTYYYLKRAGINTLGQICERTPEDLWELRDFDRKNYEEILKKLQEYDVRLKESEKEIEEDTLKNAGKERFSQELETYERVTDIPVEKMRLSDRTYNCLKRAGINTIGQICERTPDEMMKVRNLGRKSQDEIFEKLKEYGVRLKESEREEPQKDIEEDSLKNVGEERLRQEIEKYERVTDIPVEKMGLSDRACNCLKRAGINTLGQICERTPDEMMKIRNFGRKSQDEVLGRVKEFQFWFEESEKDEIRNNIREESVENAGRELSSLEEDIHKEAEIELYCQEAEVHEKNDEAYSRWLQICSMVNDVRESIIAERLVEEEKRLKNEAAERRQEVIDSAQKLIHEQTRRKEEAEKTLAALGFLKFGEKKKQKAIIEDAIRRIAEAEVLIPQADSMFNNQMARIEEIVKKMEPSIRDEVERKCPYPDEPAKS